MRRVIASAFVSLDGVVQAPGGPTEDPTGGFLHGGWLAPVADPAMGDAMGDAMGALFSRPFDLLLGRRTYDIFAAHWPDAADEDGIAPAFNACAKYVLTRGDRDLPWANSHRLAGVEDVAALKATDGPDLLIQGSTTLYPALLAAGLIDRLTLMTFPVVLGHGKRLFGDGAPSMTMRFVEGRTTGAGVTFATFEPAGPVLTAAIAPPSTSAAEAERQRHMRDGSW